MLWLTLAPPLRIVRASQFENQWHRLYDLMERHGHFSCYGRIKANREGKNPNVTNINTKKGMLLNHFVVALINVCTVKLH